MPDLSLNSLERSATGALSMETTRLKRASNAPNGWGSVVDGLATCRIPLAGASHSFEEGFVLAPPVWPARPSRKTRDLFRHRLAVESLHVLLSGRTPLGAAGQ